MDFMMDGRFSIQHDEHVAFLLEKVSEKDGGEKNGPECLPLMHYNSDYTFEIKIFWIHINSARIWHRTVVVGRRR